MKRHIALQDISREHQHTLSLAQQIIRAVQANDVELLGSLPQKIYDFCEQELKPHFQQEEKTFFRILVEEFTEHEKLVESYLQEHKTLLKMVTELGSSSSSKQLEDFSTLLKSHTRREERELFPMIEECFTEQQLLKISTS